MNERLLKLAEKHKFVHEHMSPGEKADAIRKFQDIAELIVRECTDVCEEYRGTKWGKAAECIGDSIREHFGVEE